jgi:hypothetical protein
MRFPKWHVNIIGYQITCNNVYETSLKDANELYKE